MQQLKILNTRESKEILNLLKTQFNYSKKLKDVFLKNEKNKVYLLTRDIAGIDTNKLRIDKAGLYIGEITDNGIRLSIEGSQIIGPEAEKNILTLNDKQAKEWLRGEDLDNIKIKADSPFLIINHSNDFLGCGKLSKEGKLYNYVPKIRRITVS